MKFSTGYKDGDDNKGLIQRFSLPRNMDNVHVFKPPSSDVDVSGETNSTSAGVSNLFKAVLKLVVYENAAPCTDDNENSHQNPPSESIEISRSANPTNEFEHNEEIFMGAYFHLFFLGNGIPFKGSANQKYLDYLMCFFDGRFARDHSFIFMLNNQKLRHLITREVKAKLTSDPKRRVEIETYMNDTKMSEKLQHAIQNPKALQSKSLFRKLNQLCKCSC